VAADFDYIAYIDETGDTGLKLVQPLDPEGSSEWFMLGAAVISAKRETEVAGWATDLARTAKSRRPALHYRDIRNPQNKLAVCEAMAKLPARYFIVAFNKKNMRGHSNFYAERRAETLVGKPQNSHWLYHWAIRILLEKVSAYVLRKSMKQFGEPRIVRLEFSRSGGIRYDEIREYLRLLRFNDERGTQTKTYDVITWSTIDVDQIGAYKHETRPGLQLADAVASSFGDASDIMRPSDCFPEPAIALRDRMGRTAAGIIHGCGVKLVPKWRIAKLREDQARVWRYYGYGREGEQ